MGYTHYWRINESLTVGQWAAICERARDILNMAGAIGIPTVHEYDEPNLGPEINAQRIRFNGLGDDGHETFILEPGPRGQERYSGEDVSFSFCKTARKPYDGPVVAILMEAERITNGTVEWSSDGDGEPEQKEVAQAILDAIGPEEEPYHA